MTEDSASGQAPTVGTELGGYRIESLLGRGGMGVVYRALDLALDRNVALKLLAPELAEDVAFRERFHRESRLAAALDHPAIVPIYDAGEVAGQLYIAMRLVEGTDLKRLLAREGTLEPERALELLQPIADALDAAHERGLVHRDVKPSNVLIDERGHSYLADFGLSRRLADAGDLVGDGLTLGTIDYVSPEQIRGEELDGRADLYSLGCILYECLAGRPPFAGSDPAIVYAHLEEDPPALSGADAVIRKALAKNPEERYPSGRELMDAAKQELGLLQPARSKWPLVAGAIGIAVAAVAVGVALVGRGNGVPADPTADSLIRIDSGKNEIAATIPVGHKTSGVAVRGEYVWVANGADRSVWRIDRATDATVKIAVKGSPTGVAATPSKVLVASNPERTLTTIDPASGAVDVTRQLAGEPRGAIRVAAGPTLVRYADPSPGVVADLQGGVKRGVAVHSVTVPRDDRTFLAAYQSFGGLAMDAQWIWATGDAFGRSLFRIQSAADERVVESLELPFVPGSVVAGGGLVWVASPIEDRVWTIDPSFGKARIVSSVAVPRGVVGLAYADGAVWVASSIDRVVSRLDPSTGRVVARINMDGAPTAIAADESDVWVTTARATPVVPEGAIGIGVLADCAGTRRTDYASSLAGAERPLLDLGARRTGSDVTDGVTGAEIAGKPVALVLGCTDGTATSAITEARRLAEQRGARILIGPTAAAEAIGLMEYAKLHPEITFVDGSAGAQMLSPPPNAFSFHLDLASSMAGLGTYAFRTLGWRRAVVVGDLDDAFDNWGQAAGFTAEFCALGGKIVERVWVPRGTQDYDKAVGAVAPVPPPDADGVFAATSKETLLALYRAHGELSGSIGAKLITGTTAGGFDYRDPVAHATVGPTNVSYRGAMSAALDALEVAGGDLSNNAERFRQALAAVSVTSPSGDIVLDEQRRAIGQSIVVRAPDDDVLRRVDGVEHTFAGYFTPNDPAPSPTNPACKHGHAPRWTR